LRRSPQHLLWFCVLVSVGLAAAAFAWGVVLLIAVPRGLGAWLLGAVWRPTYPLVLPQILYVTGQAATTGTGVGLHALGAARRSLRVAVITSVITVVCALAGAVADGATGAVSGMAASAWVGVIFYWLELRAAMRESSSIPGHGSLRSLRTASRPTVGRPGKSEGHRK